MIRFRRLNRPIGAASRKGYTTGWSQITHKLTGLGEQERGQWLEQRLLDAEAWGLVNERSIAIWLERCACWGNDFAMRSDSPYQAWLARHQTPRN